MLKSFSKRFKRPFFTLMPGEYYSNKEPVIISTILGSCISVCIFDSKNKIGGMNHFMLPGKIDLDMPIFTDIGRYGMYAMDLLIGDMIKHGAERVNMKAKVFGGASLLAFRKEDGDLSSENIMFAKEFLSLEHIPLVSKDTGGNAARKIFFFTETGKVLLKRLPKTSVTLALKNEQKYKNNLLKKRSDHTRTFLFDV
ncbi:MAG: chemotaxis protein CheD [Pseudomonadota bacterium]